MEDLLSNIDTSLSREISKEIAWNYEIVPFKKVGDKISFLTPNGKAIDNIKHELEIILGKEIELIEDDTFRINELLTRLYQKSSRSNFDVKVLRDHNNFVNDLIGEANKLGSSDIHIEITEKEAKVRMRIDGKLIERFKLDKAEYPAIINKIKIQSNLDISEKRLPQDGRIKLNSIDFSLDLRVSIIPTINGEKVVLRLLSKDSSGLKLEQIGFETSQLSDYRKLIRAQNGIILISGPTGSGKTTTLYATLTELNDGNNNILTIEDPIEYTMDGINQVQLKENIGLSFSKALKSFLRQDPDIIMVGEIRDQETANMAIRAALTGHLVFSTIHTNSAWATVSRLHDMNIPNYLIAATLKMSVAQRLVRRLCPDCKEKEESLDINIGQEFLEKLNGNKIFKSVGCENCYYTGYKGRLALHEVIPIDHALKQEIQNNNLDETKIIESYKINSLADQAVNLVLNGDTSLEEIYSILIEH